MLAPFLDLITDKVKKPMPFLIETLDAVRIICDEVAEGSPVIRFPWPMAAASSTRRLNSGLAL